MSCELGQDPSVAEVVGEVRLAATGELLSHVAAAANRSALEIAGLSPGECGTVAKCIGESEIPILPFLSLSSLPSFSAYSNPFSPFLLFWLLFLIFCQNYGYFPKQVAR